MKKKLDEDLFKEELSVTVHPFLTTNTYVRLLQLCTISGNVEEFKQLNVDLHKLRLDPEYVAEVKKAFSQYLGEYVLESEKRTAKATDICLKGRGESVEFVRDENEVSNVTSKSLGYEFEWVDVEGIEPILRDELLTALNKK